VVPSERGARALGEGGRAALGRSLAEHLARDFDRVLVPRAWRYVEALPEDAQGKVTVAALRALFDTVRGDSSPPLEPAWRELERTADALVVSARVPEELASLHGHFPAAPIVAGTVQLDWAVELARSLVGCELAPARVEALKFGAPLAPGDECTLRVERRDTSDGAAGVRVRFRLFAAPGAAGDAEREFASGRLVLVDASSLEEPGA
jgi:hypothetical protein